jgi:AbiV family abortive infection protein
MGKPVVQPAAQDLVALVQTTVQNARSLLEDARLLFEAGRYPRAHALAVLALEEFGKHMMCVSRATQAIGVADTEEEFWRRFNDHKAKLREAKLLIEAILKDPERRYTQFANRLLREAASDHATKLAGLYVDFDGTITEPLQAIDQQTAASMINDVGELLDVYGDRWTGESERNWLFFSAEEIAAGGHPRPGLQGLSAEQQFELFVSILDLERSGHRDQSADPLEPG